MNCFYLISKFSSGKLLVYKLYMNILYNIYIVPLGKNVLPNVNQHGASTKFDLALY